MLIDNKNLFPLKFLESRLLDYYMDVDGEIYSTKRAGKLIRLSGSIPNNSWGRGLPGTTRRYTLNGVSFSHDELKARAFATVAFVAETDNPLKRAPGGYGPKVLSAKSLGVDLANVKAPIPPQQPASLSRVHAPTLEAGILGKGYMIAAYDSAEGLLFTKRPAVHLTLESAKAEMERLAKEVPGTQFVLVKIMNTIVSGGVTWQ